MIMSEIKWGDNKMYLDFGFIASEDCFSQLSFVGILTA
jgi:hypothetical protein